VTTNQSDALTNAVTSYVSQCIHALEVLERAQRYTEPGSLTQLAEILQPVAEDLQRVSTELSDCEYPPHLEPFTDHLMSIGSTVRKSLDGCLALDLADEVNDETFFQWLRSLRYRTRATESLYPLAALFTPVNAYFVEQWRRSDAAFLARLLEAMQRTARQREAAQDDDAEPAKETDVGIMSYANDRRSRGGFSLYVPEYYDAARQWPLIVAMHGGSGHGADFIWTWLREARSRGFIVLAPTSTDRTWALMGNDRDRGNIENMLRHVIETWSIDEANILLTGMSDGATYASLIGLDPDTRWSAVAPISGMLHPVVMSSENLGRVAERRIFLVHGDRDWMFPVETAHDAHHMLRDAGASIHFEAVPDLAHTYPREMNATILDWFSAATRAAPNDGD
jgi:phospholipase/carboxylesterase